LYSRVRKYKILLLTPLNIAGEDNKMVTDVLSSISKTIQLAGQPSPLYRAENVNHLSLQQLVKGFQEEDPTAAPQLAVPITVPNMCFRAGMLSRAQSTKAAGNLP
jgi:hypothetical protein